MDQSKFNEIMDGMEEVNRSMVKKIEATAPVCHFRKMMLEAGDSVDGFCDEWWECSVCGHTKPI